MPAVSAADLIRLRTQPHRSDLYLVVHQPLTVLSAAVISVADNNTEVTIAGAAYGTDASGAAWIVGDLEANLTMWVGSAAGGKDRGLVRFKSVMAGDPPTKIEVAENDDIDWTNAYITIVDEFRVWPVFPRTPLRTPPTDVDWYKDYDKTYSAQNEKFRPVPIMGPPVVGFLDGATLTFQWDGSASYTIRTGAAIGTYAWVSQSGTVTGGNTATPTTRYNYATGHAGDRNRLRVTDNVGGDTRSYNGYRYAFVMSRSGTNAPYGANDTEVALLSLSGGWTDGGYTMEVEVRDGTDDGSGRPDANKFQDGNQVILFSEDFFGYTSGSVGSLQYREPICFVGYILGDSVSQNARTGAVIFSAQTIHGVLSRCDMYPIVLEDATTAQTNEWYKMENLDIQRVLHHLFFYHSTVVRCADLFLPDYNLAAAPWINRGRTKAAGWEFSQQNLYSMADATVMQSAIVGKCASDKFSRLFMEKDVQALDDGNYAPTFSNERAAIPTVMGLLKQDIREPLEIEEASEAITSQVRLSGVYWPGGGIEGDPDLDNLAAYFSYAPGDCMKTRGAGRDQGNLALDNQNQANTMSGMLLAKDNNRYPVLRAPLTGNYRVFDIVPQEYVTMSLAASDTDRGIVWTNKKLVVRGIEHEYVAKPGTLLTTLLLEPETTGKPGETIIFPDQPPDEPPYEPPPEPEPPGPGPYPGWREKIYVSTNTKGIYYTADFSGPGGGDPTWATVNTGLGVTTTRTIIGDPWNPAGRQYTRTAEPKIYRRTGGAWSVILDNVIVAAVTGVPVGAFFSMMGPECNINAQGHVYALVSFHDGGILGYRLYLFKSANYGNNWAAHLITDSWFLSRTPYVLRVGALKGSSAFGAGQVIYAVFQNTATWIGMRVSTDQGVTWGATIGLSHCAPSGPWVDLGRSPADQDIIYQVGHGSTLGVTTYTMVKSVNRGGAFITLWPCAISPIMTQRPNVYIWNPLSAFMAAGGDGLHWTENDWTNYVTHTNTDNFDVDGCSRVMDSPELLYGIQATTPLPGQMDDVIAVSDDRGDNWEGKAGPNPGAAPYTNSIPENCGGISGMLQIWTE